MTNQLIENYKIVKEYAIKYREELTENAEKLFTLQFETEEAGKQVKELYDAMTEDEFVGAMMPNAIMNPLEMERIESILNGKTTLKEEFEKVYNQLKEQMEIYK